MIYILVGEELKSKGLYIKEVTKNREIIFLGSSILTRDLILNYSSNISLFNEFPVIVVENILKEENIIFSATEFDYLKDSKTIFIFKEDKLTALEQKKYKKHATIENFDVKKIIIEKFNAFSITDAYANRDKIGAWVLYRKGIESGVEPEAIAGILFWKIKTMLLNSTKIFSKEELKKQSSQIVSLYHNAHRGEVDFIIGLEQFILTSLSSH